MRYGVPSITSIGRPFISSMRQGRIRHHQFGEGEYQESELIIQQLLAEASDTPVSDWNWFRSIPLVLKLPPIGAT